ncbi:hypothetical protein A3K82_00680 [Candidatus Pacearchaeota archaeon RBG_19FT_COMBO_34_9]|jgi:antitoxin component of MazEF toxin-antitoxin module|nr:MAG: hypothetical protein A3K82_00680 [Candidatus Pacearchaeota archaeon RBG_19FT_COMBO_34_9]
MVGKEELDELLKINADIEKITKISSDGKTLVTRIPKEIAKELDITNDKKIRWFVDIKTKKIRLEIEK